MLVLGGCTADEPVADRSPQPSTASSTPSAAPSEGDEAVLPPTDGVFDYQLGGPYDSVEIDGQTAPIDVVVRDATAEPLDGAYSICYVNGFQTQPGDDGLWSDELLLHDSEGDAVIDPDWPDESVLDPSSEKQRAGILAVIGPVIDGCADDGYDAVEIDNLDTWTRFPEIDEAGAHALARAYVDRAHRAGLAIAQKNAAEITEVARTDLGFDFAVAEECAVWDECGAYRDAYGEHVLQIEYPDALFEAGLTFANACAAGDRAPLTIQRDRELVAVGGDDYLYEAC